MIETLHISKYTATDKKKDGTPLVGKFGPFWRVSFQCTEHEGWISGFVNGAQKPEDWNGKEVSLEIYEEDYLGAMQKKFKIPKQSSKEMADMDAKIETTLNKITGIGLRVEGLAERIARLEGVKPKGIEYPVNDVPEPFPDVEDQSPF